MLDCLESMACKLASNVKLIEGGGAWAVPVW